MTMQLDWLILAIVGAHLALDVWRWVAGLSQVRLWRKRARGRRVARKEK